MLLHELDNADIRLGDTLLDPKFLTADGRLRTFDIVIANPPFSLKNWGREQLRAGDPYGRLAFGLPPKNYGDLAFLQHMIASLNDTGRAGVVLPHGPLFRSGGERRIRQGMVDEDLIEAVVGLPAKLFYGTSIPACILILNKAKPIPRSEKILFINGANDYEEGNNQHFLREEDVAKISTAFRAYESVERYCRVVYVDEVQANDYNLNISRYVDTTEPEEEIEVGDAILL